MRVSWPIPLEEAVISLLAASVSEALSSLMRALQVVAPSMGKATMVRRIDARQNIHSVCTGILIFCVIQINALPGLYTQCLERCIVMPGFEARKMFHRVGQIVLQLSDGGQHPVRTCGCSIFDLLHIQ